MAKLTDRARNDLKCVSKGRKTEMKKVCLGMFTKSSKCGIFSSSIF